MNNCLTLYMVLFYFFQTCKQISVGYKNLGIPHSTNSTYTMTEDLYQLLLAFGFSCKHFIIIAIIYIIGQLGFPWKKGNIARLDWVLIVYHAVYGRWVFSMLPEWAGPWSTPGTINYECSQIPGVIRGYSALTSRVSGPPPRPSRVADASDAKRVRRNGWHEDSWHGTWTHMSIELRDLRGNINMCCSLCAPTSTRTHAQACARMH